MGSSPVTRRTPLAAILRAVERGAVRAVFRASGDVEILPLDAEPAPEALTPEQEVDAAFGERAA